MLVGTGMLELLGWRALVEAEVSRGSACSDHRPHIQVQGGHVLQLGCTTYLRPPGVPEMEVFLELGRELLILGLHACRHTGVSTAKIAG